MERIRGKWSDAERQAEMRRALGERLRNLRAESGIVLSDVAAQSGISYNYICDIERGSKMPPLPTLVALCETYGVLVTEALRGLFPFDTDKAEASRTANSSAAGQDRRSTTAAPPDRKSVV